MRVKVNLQYAFVFVRASFATFVPTLQVKFLTAKELYADFHHTTMEYGVKVE
jgi:hypothetical protein